jgi:hypothetical protein
MRRGQLGARDLFEAGPVPEIGGGELVEMGGRHEPQRRPQLRHLVGAKPVVDACALPPGRDQPSGGEGAEVERRVRQALADLRGEVVNVSFALGQHVDDLGPPAVRQRLGDLGEPVEQASFATRSLIPHPFSKLCLTMP